MTNEELRAKAEQAVSKGIAPESLWSETHRLIVIAVEEALTQVRNEAIEEARITAYKMIASRPPYGYRNVHLADGLSQAIEALKDGAK